jgi:hypothetical protein
MPSKTNQLPKGGVVKPPPPRRNYLLLYLAGGALLVIIVGVVLFALAGRGSSGTSSPAQVTGQAKLAVDREQIDFGKVPLDKPIKATFVLSNIGDQPLALQGMPVVEVKQGC